LQYCEVELPFANRGQIINMDVTPTVGSVVINSNRRSLKWNIGKRQMIFSKIKENFRTKIHWKKS